MHKQIAILSTRQLRSNVMQMATSTGVHVICEDYIRTSSIINLDLAATIAVAEQPYVFTSVNGVKAYQENRERYGLLDGPRRAYCLNGETMQAVNRINQIQIAGMAEDAGKLATIILSDTGVTAVSYFCGNRHRDELPSMLRANQVRVDEIVVYNTFLQGKLVTEEYDAILFFSPSAVESFFQSNRLPEHIPCFCIGASTAGALGHYCHNPVSIASEASQESVMKAALKYFKQYKTTHEHDRGTEPGRIAGKQSEVGE